MKLEVETDCKTLNYKKLKLQFVSALHCHTEFCGLCLETGKDLLHHDECFEVHDFGQVQWVTMDDILKTLFSEASKLQSLASKYICEDCKHYSTDAYNFITKVKNTAEVLRDYVNQIDERIDEMQNIINTADLKEHVNMLLVLQDPSLPKMPASLLAEEVDKDFENCLNTSLVEYIDDSITADDSIDDSESDTLSFIKNNYICDFCQQKFSNKTGIIRHIHETHNKSAPYLTCKKKRKRNKISCKDCEKQPCLHEKYWKAIREAKTSGNIEYQCPGCDYKCDRKENLLAHANKIHLQLAMYICEYCAQPLYSKIDHRRHIATYHTNFHTCEFCGTKFKLRERWLKHENVCKNQSLPYKCDRCSASFSSELRLSNHRDKHQAATFPCKLCNKEFTSEFRLSMHQKVHRPEPRSKKSSHKPCGICGKEFFTVKSMRIHLNSHGRHEKPKCILCGLSFHFQKAFEKHHKQHRPYSTSNKRLISCEYCDYTTKNRRLLDSHVNVKHLKMAPYRCDVCNRNFTNEKVLQHHVKSHSVETQEVLYKCDVCGNNFRCAIGLKLHLRRHTGEKPYKCDVCEERFISASLRSIHKQRSHGEKKIKCPLCEQNFYTVMNMRSHFKSVHWKRKEKFDYTKVKDLKEEDYVYFKDRRFIDNILSVNLDWITK